MYSFTALFVLIAATFDMLDGITARLIKSASEFGVQLDSLSDAISFGLVPSFLLYKVYFYQFQDIGLLISALPLICGVLRLARFNIQTSAFKDKKFFNGMPIPSAAFMIISYLLFYHQNDFLSNEVKRIAIIIVTILTSVAMISTIKFYNAPRPSWAYIKENPIKSLIFLLAIILSIVSKGLFIFPFFVLYLFVSFIRHFFIKIRHFSR